MFFSFRVVLELSWPEATSTFPVHSWEWLRMQHQPGTIPNGWFGCSYPTPERDFHGYRHWQAVPAGPRTGSWTLALLGLPGESHPQLTHPSCDWENSVVHKNASWCPKLAEHLQPWWIRAFSVPLHGKTMWQRQEQDHIPCRQLSNASCSCDHSHTGFGLVFWLFFPVCVPSILLFVVVGLGLFICLFFISFGLVSYFWFQYGYVDLGFFS